MRSRLLFVVAFAGLASACNGVVYDAETRGARERFERAIGAANRGRDACLETNAGPATDALAKKKGLDPMVGYGKLTVAPSSALCVDVAASIGGTKVVECDVMPKKLFESLALTAHAMPCTPTRAEVEKTRSSFSDFPRRKEKAAWLKRVAVETDKLEELARPAAPTKAPAYVVTECKSPMFSSTGYEGRADNWGSRPVGAAVQFDCYLTVFWIDGAGNVTAFAHGYGSRKAFGAEVETQETLAGKNAGARGEAIAMAADDLLSQVARRR